MLFSGQNCLMTQMEANKYFERFDFELHSKFVKVIQIVSNAAFYAAVFPLGLVITMAGLVLTYWSSKIFLVKYCTIPKQSYRLGRLVVIFILTLERYNCVFPNNSSVWICIK